MSMCSSLAYQQEQKMIMSEMIWEGEMINSFLSSLSGCEVRYVEGGHVTAHVLRQPQYRAALAEAMSRSKFFT